MQVWVPNQTDQRPRSPFPQRGDLRLNTALCSSTQKEHVVLPTSEWTSKVYNKTLQNILRKIVNEHRTNWDKKLNSALWAYRTSFKTSIHATLFSLAYGLEAVMPMQFQIPSLRIQVRERMTEEATERICLQQLLALGETLVNSLAVLELDQQRRKAFVDRHRGRASIPDTHWPGNYAFIGPGRTG